MPTNANASPIIPLTFKEHFEKGYEDFPVVRLKVTALFETRDRQADINHTIYDGVIVDTGSPFCILAHDFHSRRDIHIHQELGLRPYRVLSMTGQPVLQRFCRIGIRLYCAQLPSPAYVPDQFLSVQAYLLDASQRPGKGVIIGLQAIRQHFRLHVEADNAHLQVRSSLTPPLSTPLPLPGTSA